MSKSKRKKKKKAVRKNAPWREACQLAMYDATQREAVRKHGLNGYSFNYRWEHVYVVVQLAIKLGKITGADLDIVEAAAWLHDICKERRDDHPKEGAEFARNFLADSDFPKKKIKAVANAIEQHMGLWRDKPLTDLESMVIWDADKLSKIGLTAAFHWMGGDLAGKKTRTMRQLIKRGRSADWQVKTVQSMHTEPARRAAKARFEAYSWLWDTLEREIEGGDLY